MLHAGQGHRISWAGVQFAGTHLRMASEARDNEPLVFSERKLTSPLCYKAKKQRG